MNRGNPNTRKNNSGTGMSETSHAALMKGRAEIFVCIYCGCFVRRQTAIAEAKRKAVTHPAGFLHSIPGTPKYNIRSSWAVPARGQRVKRSVVVPEGVETVTPGDGCGSPFCSSAVRMDVRRWERRQAAIDAALRNTDMILVRHPMHVQEKWMAFDDLWLAHPEVFESMERKGIVIEIM